MKITTIGIDLAKNVFRLHGVDTQGKVVLRSRFRMRRWGRTEKQCSLDIRQSLADYVPSLASFRES